MYEHHSILDVFRLLQHDCSVGCLGNPHPGDQVAPSTDTTETLADVSISAWSFVSASSWRV
jgi:hypothetical protein